MADAFLVFLSAVNPLTIWDPHDDPNLGLRGFWLLLESTLDLHGFDWLSNMISSFIFSQDSNTLNTNHARVAELYYNAKLPASKRGWRYEGFAW
jgi:hypothetical protein